MIVRCRLAVAGFRSQYWSLWSMLVTPEYWHTYVKLVTDLQALRNENGEGTLIFSSPLRLFLCETREKIFTCRMVNCLFVVRKHSTSTIPTLTTWVSTINQESLSTVTTKRSCSFVKVVVTSFWGNRLHLLPYELI